MKTSNKLISTVFGALLATQTLPALGQESRQLAEPFRIDVSEILRGEQGQLIRVENPTQLAERYTPGSSVVVEGDFGLTDRVLQELQREINENYSHLNILVYLAEDGRSFEEYNGQRLQSSDLCGTNPGLAYLRDSFYEGADQAGEGNHIIFYLAAREPGYDYNMVCALISPQMAELIGSDEQIFVSGRPIFDNVFNELKQDFNKLGAIRAFLSGVNERVERAQREMEQERLAHIISVRNIRTQVSNYSSGISAVNIAGISIETSSLYLAFDAGIMELEAMVIGEEEYVSEDTLEQANSMLADVDHAYNQLVSAISSFDVSRNRVVELQEFIVEFRQGEYSHELSEELNQLELSLIETQTKLDAGNVDYYSDISVVEENYRAILNGVSSIKTREAAKNIGMGGAAIGFLSTLGYLNRRKRRIDSREEFVNEFEKLEIALKEMKRIFSEEIEGNTESIEMFFGDQKGNTKSKIEDLKKSVAYISVLLPKISEILEFIKSSLSVTSLSKFRALPYEKAIDMMFTDKHIIDPSSSDGDKKLLEKISGTSVQDFSELVDNMNKTLPELTVILDSNITLTKDIFSELEEASDNFENEIEKNEGLNTQLNIEIQNLFEYIGPNFSHVFPLQGIIQQKITDIKESHTGDDILGEYANIKDLNRYIEEFIYLVSETTEYIKSNQPSQYRITLEEAGYDTSSFLEDIQGRFSGFLDAFYKGFEQKNFSITTSKKQYDSIKEFYSEMEKLSTIHSVKVSEGERYEGLKGLRNRASTDIREQLGDRLKSDVLFTEEEHNLVELLTAIDEQINNLGGLIAQRDISSTGENISTLKSQLNTGHEIIARSRYVVGHFDENVERLGEMKTQLEGNIEGIGEKIKFLKKSYDKDIMILRASDFHADDTDKDISNNVNEVEGYIATAKNDFETSSLCFEKGEFMKAQEILEHLYKQLQLADQRIQEVRGVYSNVTEVTEKNPQEVERLERDLDAIINKSQDVHITDNTKEKIRSGLNQLEGVKYALGEKKSHPYNIEDSLFEIDAILKKLDTEIDRDESEYQEYLEYSKEAGKIYQKLQRHVGEAVSDNEPDSRKARKVIGSINDIGDAYKRLSQYTDRQNSDWYQHTDDLEGFIELCESKINILFQDEKDRLQAYNEMIDAAKQVKKAKRWSGRYVSISGSIGEDHLRSAHTAFNIGDFSSVISYTSKAEKEARNKISDAETRDRREKKKRDDAAAAARRRRQRSYSSSSSSSFGGGGGGGGFTGFSGGGGF